MSQKGDTIHIPEISNLTANDKAANTAVTLQTVSESSQTISIDQHKETSFMVEDIVKAQSQYNLNNIGFFYRKVVDILRKLRGTLYETIRSETQKWGRSETIIAAPALAG